MPVARQSRKHQEQTFSKDSLRLPLYTARIETRRACVVLIIQPPQQSHVLRLYSRVALPRTRGSANELFPPLVLLVHKVVLIIVLGILVAVDLDYTGLCTAILVGETGQWGSTGTFIRG